MTIGQNAVGAAFTVETSTAKFKLGTRMLAGESGQEYIYAKASGSALAQYDWVAIDENFLAVKGTSALADAKHLFGIAQIAFTENYFGWFVVRGSDVLAKFDGTAAADIVLYTSGTAGQLSDITSGAKLMGITIVTAVSTQSQTAEVIMTYPHWVLASN